MEYGNKGQIVPVQLDGIRAPLISCQIGVSYALISFYITGDHTAFA